MGVLYPDNQKRADRVNQLAGEIAQIQSQIKEAVEDAAAHDQKTIELLDTFAKNRGFKSLDELVQDAQNQLSEEDRKKYQEMKNQFGSKDGRIDLALKSSLGLIGSGIKVGLTATALSALFQRSLLKISLQAIGLGLVKIITGDVTVGVDVLKVAGNILGSVLKGEYLTGKVASAFKILTTAGKVLSYLGIALDGIVLIYEAIDGAKQREQFQQAIKDLCVRRLTTKKIQRYTQVTLTYASDAKAVVDYANSVQGLVSSGELTQSAADQKVQVKMKELEPKITKAVNEIDDESVYKLLQTQDTTNNSWTNEDPTFAEIEKMIEAVEAEK